MRTDRLYIVTKDDPKTPILAHDFTLGQKVKPSKYMLAKERPLKWRVNGKMTNDVTGIVRGFGRTSLSLTVQVVGQKRSSSYYVGFWEPK